MSVGVLPTVVPVLAVVGIMAVSIARLRRVFGLLEIIRESARSPLRGRLVLLRSLMIGFAVAYAGTIVALPAGLQQVSNVVLGAILFFGALFVNVGVALQVDMGHQIATLRGIVPMCAHCKKVRRGASDDPAAQWEPVDTACVRSACR